MHSELPSLHHFRVNIRFYNRRGESKTDSPTIHSHFEQQTGPSAINASCTSKGCDSFFLKKNPSREHSQQMGKSEYGPFCRAQKSEGMRNKYGPA
ncbi:hypothetical protein PEDI_44730 [Persicobacter diffluens]|uniref:Uncharacterized protein n=1 Tax=Persicobacter diffluens TaxID=981 RepID=A0AAN4W1F6_9BACT|nr:hypothetical protein PEDI_44730 [Persicobacter diffluens]